MAHVSHKMNATTLTKALWWKRKKAVKQLVHWT